MGNIDLSTQFITIKEYKDDFAQMLIKSHPLAVAVEVYQFIDLEQSIITFHAVVLWEDAHICHHITKMPFAVAKPLQAEESKMHNAEPTPFPESDQSAIDESNDPVSPAETEDDDLDLEEFMDDPDGEDDDDDDAEDKD